MTKDSKGWRGLNIRMKWLEIAISSGRKEYLPELISYSGPVYEFETRSNALNVLRKLDYLDPVATGNAITASLHWNGKLAASAKEVLNYFYQQDAYRDMIRQTLNTMELSPKERSAVEQTLTRRNG